MSFGGHSTSCVEYYEHSVNNFAMQNWSSAVISFPGGLGGRAGGIKLPLVNGLFFAKKWRMRAGRAQSRWVALVHCVLSVRKEGAPPSLGSQC